MSSTDVKEVLAETGETQSIVSQLEKKAETVTADLVSARIEMAELKNMKYSSTKVDKEIDLSQRIGENGYNIVIVNARR